ncbi:hypothetical protein PRK78_003261 [Emydomyces testavorans]|uniref:Uncharacterized protein n=1 Tax=Emydomyces testavorans TaxID=2070801 RepID=A0AAF0IKF0_9EURO|nr:hypothetical protein PRK78_003261 [Emydomyces testavorans]
MARIKKNPSASQADQLQIPPPKKPSMKSSLENEGSSKFPQQQKAASKKKPRAKVVHAGAQKAFQTPQTEGQVVLQTAVISTQTKENKPDIRSKKYVQPALAKQRETHAKNGKATSGHKPASHAHKTITSPNLQSPKQAHAKPQKNKTSPDLTEEELDKIFRSDRKDKEATAANSCHIQFEIFDQVGKASVSKGLEASCWAVPSTESSGSASDEKRHRKGRSSHRNKKKGLPNKTSPTNNSPHRSNNKANNTQPMASRKEIAPIIDTVESKAAEEQAVHVGKILFDAFDELGKSSTRPGLEASRWAIPAETTPLRKENERVNKVTSLKESQQTPRNIVPRGAMNVDNTSAFMAALRARSTQVLKGRDILIAQETQDNGKDASTSDRDVLSVTKSPENLPEIQHPETQEIEVMRKTAISVDRVLPDASTSESSIPVSKDPVKDVKEDREHLEFFSSWGNPSPRSRPHAEIRRIILSPIPDFLATPNKVLSLVHGGRIESVRYFPQSKSAHVLFCDPEACKQYYNLYPNGIEVNVNGRKAIVFVDQSKEIDIVSSRLQESLNLGATRVVRAVGVDMALNMQNLVDLAEDRNFKLEKIIDVFDGSTRTRTVVFRLCSIEHAVRLRSYLVRQDEWEQANVQFAPDP